MANLKDYFNPEHDMLYKKLIEENPKIDPSFLVNLIIADCRGQVAEKIEVKLKDTEDKQGLFNALTAMYKDYSNNYTIYGKKSKEEAVVQLTVKNPSKVLELAKKDYVEIITEATHLSSGFYFHVSELDNNIANLSKLEGNIDKFLAKSK